jgi:hypothetical protein
MHLLNNFIDSTYSIYIFAYGYDSGKPGKLSLLTPVTMAASASSPIHRSDGHHFHPRDIVEPRGNNNLRLPVRLPLQ